MKQNIYSIKNKHKEKWNEWFAGITDGDGCFYINKKNEISYEVTTHTTDFRILADIKNTLKGGTIHSRSGSNSMRYRVKEKKVLQNIVSRVNGKLYNKSRLAQFDKVCEILGVDKIESPRILIKESAYLAGIIDSDGTITISVSKSSSENSQISGSPGKALRLANSRGYNQLSLKVTSIYEDSIRILTDSYNFGTIYKEKASLKNKSPNIKYNWVISSYEEFSQVYELLKKFPLRGVKMHRIRLAFFILNIKI
uniref:Putative LAGLIDADG homing endonuclease n=1 Tax=Lobochlamys culleus TaxID=51693 RepID=A0A0S2IDE4_9CHLO|nr:putative LAGLIDADG homing endonuclease [Lobochlamys culleus]